MNAPLLPALPGYDNPELIAHGTTALVFRAVQTTLNRLVAIKVITVDTGSVVPVNAARELATTVALSSQPHIVSIIDTGVTEDDRPYIVMEYCEGGSYAAILRHNGPLPLVDVLEVGVKIGEALHAAHQAGIVHRDVKPSNILRSRFGPALTDFGIARAPDELGSTLTRELMTPHHASPEALLHQAQSGISDIYSLASTMWTLLVGHPPFVDPLHPTMDMYAFRDRVLHDELPPMPRQDVPTWLVTELRRAMSKLPSARHRSALDFAESLRRGALGLGPPETDPSPSQSLAVSGLLEAANASGFGPPSAFVPPPPREREPPESTLDRPSPVPADASPLPAGTSSVAPSPSAPAAASPGGGSLPTIGAMTPPANGPSAWSSPPPGIAPTSSPSIAPTSSPGGPGPSTGSTTDTGSGGGVGGIGAGTGGSDPGRAGGPEGSGGPGAPAPREVGGATTGGRSAAPPKPPVIPPLPPAPAGSPAGAPSVPPAVPLPAAAATSAPAPSPSTALPGAAGPAPDAPAPGGPDWAGPTQANPAIRPGTGVAFPGPLPPFGGPAPAAGPSYAAAALEHAGTEYADTGFGDPGSGAGAARRADGGGWGGPPAPAAPYPHRQADGSGTRRLDERSVVVLPPNRRGVLVGVLVAVAVLAVAGAAVLILVAKDRSATVARGPSQTTAAPPSTTPQTTRFITNDPFGAPTNTKLTDHGTEVTLTWSDPSPGSAPFIVIGSGPNGEQLPAQNVDRGTTTATFQQLSPTKNYCFRVGAIYSATRVSIADPICTKR